MLKEENIRRAHGYSERVSEVERWFRLLLENCAEDNANADRYVGNARSDISDYMAEAATIQYFVEQYILKMMENKKTRKHPELTSALTTLMLGKILQQLKEAGAFHD